MGTTTRIHLCADDSDDTVFLPGRQLDALAATVRDQPLQPIRSKIVLVPKVDLNRHGRGDILIEALLNRGLEFPIDQSLELAGGGVGEMRGLELVEPVDLRFQEVPHRRAEHVARRVQPRVEQPLLHVDGLRRRLADAEDLVRRCEPSQMQDLPRRHGVHAHCRHGEFRGCIAGRRDAARVGWLAAALRVEDGFLGRDDRVFVRARLE